MEFEIDAVLNAVDFAPADVQTEVLQNVRTILGTIAGTVPLDRDFGIDNTLADLPLPIAQARLQQEVISKLRRYEPRAKVVSVSTAGDGIDGELRPVVRIRINE